MLILLGIVVALLAGLLVGFVLGMAYGVREEQANQAERAWQQVRRARQGRLPEIRL